MCSSTPPPKNNASNSVLLGCFSNIGSYFYKICVDKKFSYHLCGFFLSFFFFSSMKYHCL